jgi:hypothetical protein
VAELLFSMPLTILLLAGYQLKAGRLMAGTIQLKKVELVRFLKKLMQRLMVI